MEMSFLKRISSITLFFLFNFGLNLSSFGQSLDPLETQPSDFGEIRKDQNHPKGQISENINQFEKSPLSAMEAFVAQAKESAIKNSEIRNFGR